MCKFYVDKFESERNEYVKKLINFKYKCEDDHVLFVSFSENHPYDHTPVAEKKSTCASELWTCIYNFCVHVKYLLNLKCYKRCLERVTVSIQDKLITTGECFKTMKSCEPFFILIKKRTWFL